jgi:hypothetical protein
VRLLKIPFLSANYTVVSWGAGKATRLRKVELGTERRERLFVVMESELQIEAPPKLQPPPD